MEIVAATLRAQPYMYRSLRLVGKDFAKAVDTYKLYSRRLWQILTSREFSLQNIALCKCALQKIFGITTANEQFQELFPNASDHINGRTHVPSFQHHSASND